MKPAPPSPAMVGMLAGVVEERCGLRFDAPRRTELISNLMSAFAGSGCATWEDYLQSLQSDAGADLFRVLVERLTIGETYFFRHRQYFELLERSVLPALIKRHQTTRSIRAWCAGCATGEEAYSLAILMHRAIPNIERWHISILATDLNQKFLARAENGFYGNWSFRETDEMFRSAYFKRQGNNYRIRPDIQRLVHFAELNLAEATYPSAATETVALDLIVCRNVLIYFGRDLIRSVISRFHSALAPGGWLMLGPSDAFPNLLGGFASVRSDDATLYRRIDNPTLAPLETDRIAPTAHTPVQAPVSIAAMPPATMASGWREAMQSARERADRGLLAEAERYCRDAISRAGMRPEPFFLLGTLREAQGDDAEALQAFRQALYVDRTYIPAHLAIAASQRRIGRVDLAEQSLARARRLLEGRAAHEVVMADEGLTVGRLRDALMHIVDEEPAREDS